MKPLASSPLRMLAVVAALLITSAVGRAQEPGKSKVLDVEGMTAMLKGLGYDPKLTGPIQRIIVEREGKAITVNVVPGAGKIHFYLEVTLANGLGNLERLPAKALAELLAANEDIAPNYFSIEKKRNELLINSAIPNIDLTPVQLRKAIDHLYDQIWKHENLWRSALYTTFPVTPAAKKEFAILEGSWDLVKSTQKGTANDVEPGTVTVDFKGQEVVMRPKDKGAIKGTYSIDPTAKLKAMDLRDDKGGYEEGIYRLEGDELTICFSGRGAPRPTEFSAGPSTNRTLMVFRRLKQ